MSFLPIPRAFTAGRFAYRSNGLGKLPTDADLAQTVADGLRWSAMPPFAAELSPAEIGAVVEHVKRLSGYFDDDGTWFNHFEEHGQPEPLAVPAPPPLTQDLLDRGKELFGAEGSFCVACHGPEGAGDGTSAGWLLDDQGVTIRPRDLRNPIYQRGADVREIFLRIRCGIPGTPMPALSPNVPDVDVWALAFHVRSLQQTPVSFVGRGKLLYRAHGCIDCHTEAFAGVANPGAAGDWITPMADLAERLGLANAREAGILIDRLRAGSDLRTDPAVRRLAKAQVVLENLGAFRRATRDGRDAKAANGEGPPAAIPRMPAWREHLTDREIDTIVAYLLTLQLWLEQDETGG